MLLGQPTTHGDILSKQVNPAPLGDILSMHAGLTQAQFPSVARAGVSASQNTLHRTFTLLHVPGGKVHVGTCKQTDRRRAAAQLHAQQAVCRMHAQHAVKQV